VKPDILIEGRVIHTPGYTHGSVSVILPGGKIIVGDTIMRGIIRFWQPHYPLFADDISQLKESIRLILRQKPSKIFSGHGGPFDPKAVQRRFS